MPQSKESNEFPKGDKYWQQANRQDMAVKTTEPFLRLTMHTSFVPNCKEIPALGA